MKNIFVEEEETMTISKVIEMLERAVLVDANLLHIQYRPSGGVFSVRIDGCIEEFDRITHQNTYDFCKILFEALTTDGIQFDPSKHIPAANIRVLENQKIKLRYQLLPLLPSSFDVIVKLFPIDSKDKITTEK